MAWLSKKASHSSDSFNCVKYLLMFFLACSLIYIIVIIAIGHTTNEQLVFSSSKDEDGNTKLLDGKTPGGYTEDDLKKYYRINNYLSLAVIIISLIGVVRESPLISITSAICMMLAVISSTVQSDFAVNVASPILPIIFMGSLFIIYTSMIWSAEFETPPLIIEEYKWWLDQLSRQNEEHLMLKELKLAKEASLQSRMSYLSTSTPKASLNRSISTMTLQSLAKLTRSHGDLDKEPKASTSKQDSQSYPSLMD